jgi:hypothetical protein
MIDMHSDLLVVSVTFVDGHGYRTTSDAVP